MLYYVGFSLMTLLGCIFGLPYGQPGCLVGGFLGCTVWLACLYFHEVIFKKATPL